MRYKLSLIVICITIILFSGCFEDTESEHAETEKEEEKLILTDHKKRKIELEKPVNNIVSVMPSATEMIYEMEIEEKLIGVTDYCIYPQEATQKTSIGGFTDPNIEEVVALEPDLVLAGSQHQDEVEKWEEMGIACLVLMPETFEEIYDSIRLIATASGTSNKGDKLVEEMKEQIEKIKEKTGHIPEEEKTKVYYELYSNPLMSVGEESVIHEIITRAGGKNIFSDLKDEYPQVSKEVVVERNPEVILFPEDHGTEKHIAEKFKERPAWEQVNAVKNENLHAVNSDIFSRPGPRVTKAVETAAKLFYPELF